MNYTFNITEWQVNGNCLKMGKEDAYMLDYKCLTEKGLLEIDQSVHQYARWCLYVVVAKILVYNLGRYLQSRKIIKEDNYVWRIYDILDGLGNYLLVGMYFILMYGIYVGAI